MDDWQSADSCNKRIATSAVHESTSDNPLEAPMFIRSMILALGIGSAAVGCVGADAAEDPNSSDTSTESSAVLGGFSCVNGISVLCTGNILVPIDINIKDVRVLN